MSKKSEDLDKPVTQHDLIAVTDTMREIADFMMTEMKNIVTQMKKGFSEANKDRESIRLEQQYRWEKQEQFNIEISEKVDINTIAVLALDKRVRYQDDLPERVEHVENQQYTLTRRVTALEK